MSTKHKTVQKTNKQKNTKSAATCPTRHTHPSQRTNPCRHDDGGHDGDVVGACVDDGGHSNWCGCWDAVADSATTASCCSSVACAWHGGAPWLRWPLAVRTRSGTHGSAPHAPRARTRRAARQLVARSGVLDGMAQCDQPPCDTGTTPATTSTTQQTANRWDDESHDTLAPPLPFLNRKKKKNKKETTNTKRNYAPTRTSSLGSQQ